MRNAGVNVPFSFRNRAAWDAAKQKQEALLIGYIVGGDPDLERSLELCSEVVAAGVDIVEIGVPSRFPVFDGEVIRRGHKRALAHDYIREEALPREYWARLREAVDTPIWAMGYQRDLIETGLYMEMAQNGWIDGLVLPELSVSEHRGIEEQFAQLGDIGVDVVRFIHSGMDEEELELTVTGATIIYAQTYSGATGDPLVQLGDDLETLCRRARRFSGAMIVAGFGLRDSGRVRTAVDSGFDGAVVGSALVARCEHGEMDSLYRLIADMKLETRRST